MSPWRAGVYARVSTSQQAAEGTTSLADQARRCRLVCEQQGWTVADQYVDPGVSGEELERRPEMMRLLADARDGRIDVVVAIDTDRIARDELVFFQIFRALDRAETAVHADGTLYHPENLSQLLTRGVKAVVSSHEKRALVAKMANGQRARARSGGWPGGAAPYGYRLAYTDSSRLAQIQIDEREADMLRLAISLLVDEGLSTGETCRRLNELGYRTRKMSPWAHQNLRRVLQSETLMGRAYWGKPVGRGDHRTRVRKDGTPYYGETIAIALPPIIDQARYDATQKALSRRSYGTKRPSKPYAVSGAISACGGRLGGVFRVDRELRQYRCKDAKWNAAGNPRCDCPRLDADELEGRVWAEVCALLADPARLLAMADDHIGQRAQGAGNRLRRTGEIERRIESLQQARVQRAADALAAGLDPALVQAAVKRIEEELAGLAQERDRLAAVEADEAAAEERSVVIARLAERAARRLPTMGVEQQRGVLQLLGVRVTVLDQTKRPALRIEGPDIFALLGLGNPDTHPPRRHVARVTVPFALDVAA